MKSEIVRVDCHGQTAWILLRNWWYEHQANMQALDQILERAVASVDVYGAEFCIIEEFSKGDVMIVEGGSGSTDIEQDFAIARSDGCKKPTPPSLASAGSPPERKYLLRPALIQFSLKMSSDEMRRPAALFLTDRSRCDRILR